MKAIILKDNKQLETINVEYYKTGQKPAGLWVSLLTGKVEYTVEDLGNFQCVLRRYKAYHVGPVEETTLDIEYGSGDTIHLGLALTGVKPPDDKE